MLARVPGFRRADATTVGFRFWSLLLLILVLAITCSAFAVRFTANPILEAQQNDAVREKVLKDARSLETVLARHRLFLSYLADSPSFVDVIIGYVENADVVRDTLQTMQRPDSLSWVRVYDAFQEEVAQLEVRRDDYTNFSWPEILELVEHTTLQTTDAGRRVVFTMEGGIARVVLAVPVMHRGFPEGAVVAGFRLDPASIFPASEASRSTFIVAEAHLPTVLKQLPETATHEVLADTDLAVVLVPNVEVVQAAGRLLLARAVSAVAVVLIGAFAVFAALGRAALIEPHRKLELQKKSLAELASVAQLSNDAIVVTDLQARVTWTNPAFTRLSGYTAEEVRGLVLGRLLQGEETDRGTAREISAALRAQKAIKVEILNYRKNGTKYWVSISISPLKSEDGSIYGYMAITYDITEERAHQDALLEAKNQIEQQALHDPLTGLPNRRALDLQLQQRCEEEPPDATIVRIDLDHFKYVNDTMGHEAGDFVLCEVARILEEETKGADLPVRVGGDEFVILLDRGRASADGVVVAERMLERIKQPKDYNGKVIRVGASFGVASTSDGMLPAQDLIVGADAALYQAKDAGRNRVHLYTPELHSAVLERRSLARELRIAVANEEFVPFFQPQFDAQTHEIVGVETLARWESPELGLLYPDEFLPIAKQLSAVEDIDAILFNKALKQIADLRKHGVEIPKVSFNVTVERVQSPVIFEAVKRHIDDGPKIAFEVLESVLVEEQSDLFNFSLDRLRDMGVGIEVDDFGSGHASIVGLMHLRPDVMKIDKQLVMPIKDSQMSRDLLKQITGMANLLGMKITAEGVETMRHAEILAELGVHTLQGFAFEKALPADELRAFMLRWQETAAVSKSA